MSTTILTQYQLKLLVEAIRNAPTTAEAERTAQKLLEKRGVFVRNGEVDYVPITEPESGDYYRGWDNEDPTYVESRASDEPDPPSYSYKTTWNSSWYNEAKSSDSSSEIIYEDTTDSGELIDFDNWVHLL